MAWSRRSLAALSHLGSASSRGGSGARAIEGFETSDLPCKIAMQVPRGDGSNATFNPDQWMDPKDQRKVDDYIIYGVAAATQAFG